MCLFREQGSTLASKAAPIKVASVAKLPPVKSQGPPPPNEAANRRSTRGNPAGSAKDDHEVELPTGKYTLPDNPAEFVEEIHRKVDLTEVWHRLLRSKDEKVKQRAIEKLTGMLYDDGAISAEEPQQFVMDIDSAVARRAAEGARK